MCISLKLVVLARVLPIEALSHFFIRIVTDSDATVVFRNAFMEFVELVISCLPKTLQKT